MSGPVLGIILALLFVGLESVQFVYFGGLFQHVNPFFFGALVIGAMVILILGWAAIFSKHELSAARQNLPPVVHVNLAAAAGFGSYLASVALVEPAVVYTISAGTMPLIMWAIHYFGIPEGERPRNRTERLGCTLLLFSIVYLCAITITGHSGFVRGGVWSGIGGILLALTDGVAFTFVLVYSKRLGLAGVGASVTLGLRMVLYVAVAASVSAAMVTPSEIGGMADLGVMMLVGLLLLLPPLYAFQKAVTLLSGLTLSVLTTLGPFVIFALQTLEGRVAYSNATLFGLCLYSAGALLAAWGAVADTRQQRE